MNNITTRQQKKKLTRQAFYDAVFTQCMAGQSFSALSLRQLAREVGVVPTTFYRHFDSMEDLGRCLVEEELGTILTKLREGLLRCSTHNLEKRIAQKVQLFFTSIDDHPRYWHFLVSERFGGSDAVRQAIKTQFTYFLQVMSEDLILQPSFQTISAYERRLLADIGLNMYLSWVFDWLEHTHPKSDDIALDAKILQDRKRKMLTNCILQVNMISKGAINWQSEEELRLDD